MELEITPMLLRNKVTLNAGFVTNTPSPLYVITNGVGGGGTGPTDPKPKTPKPTTPEPERGTGWPSPGDGKFPGGP